MRFGAALDGGAVEAGLVLRTGRRGGCLFRSAGAEFPAAARAGDGLSTPSAGQRALRRSHRVTRAGLVGEDSVRGRAHHPQITAGRGRPEAVNGLEGLPGRGIGCRIGVLAHRAGQHFLHTLRQAARAG